MEISLTVKECEMVLRALDAYALARIGFHGPPGTDNAKKAQEGYDAACLAVEFRGQVGLSGSR